MKKIEVDFQHYLNCQHLITNQGSHIRCKRSPNMFLRYKIGFCPMIILRLIQKEVFIKQRFHRTQQLLTVNKNYEAIKKLQERLLTRSDELNVPFGFKDYQRFKFIH